ncbi:jasmonate-induced protein homolog [Spinacia oleracea]|uniref:Jasmonate-induced protein homolog n=1 Tax=Spinacia oleracea TaxID=3562 RepID=A0A9R0JMC3_SPIOL|nr:jasmonate-induced protein homolog [Spinacia oleracea]
MASTQQVPAMLSNDEKAIFEKVIAAAKDKSAMEVKGQVVTNGNLVNTIKDKAVLRIIDQHNWSGKPVPLYPEVLPFGEVVQFEHRGPLPGGCKGGVVYADGTDSTARKWLVAFHIPNNEYHHSGDKVYVEAGPIGPIDWNVVEVKLDASEYTSSYVDPVFGGKAWAVIHPGSILVAGFTN